MNPDFPLCWIGTTTRARDEGLYHLVATETMDLKGAPLMCGGLQIGTADSATFARAACGAHPFAYSGSFPDGGDFPSPGSRCQKCEAMAEKLRPVACARPECGYREALEGWRQMRTHDIPCPRCGQFKLTDFRPVPR